MREKRNGNFLESFSKRKREEITLRQRHLLKVLIESELNDLADPGSRSIEYLSLARTTAGVDFSQHAYLNAPRQHEPPSSQNQQKSLSSSRNSCHHSLAILLLIFLQQVGIHFSIWVAFFSSCHSIRDSMSLSQESMFSAQRVRPGDMVRGILVTEFLKQHGDCSIQWEIVRALAGAFETSRSGHRAGAWDSGVCAV